ncbi:MAG TPA: hypothetical protein VFH08_06035 [Chitinophagaceae bacterium]|nr:hypothetical protein [Chitinophagaceae bacterium]
MEPLIILIVVFIITLVSARIIRKDWLYSFAGCVAMSVMLIFTGISHFLFPEGMALMLPGFIPFKKGVIYFTGVIEIAAAAGLLIPRFRKMTAWLLIIFFIAILPANIHAAIHHVNLRTASFDGSGLNYLWFRVPLQIFFIAWVYYFGIKKDQHSVPRHFHDD